MTMFPCLSLPDVQLSLLNVSQLRVKGNAQYRICLSFTPENMDGREKSKYKICFLNLYQTSIQIFFKHKISIFYMQIFNKVDIIPLRMMAIFLFCL